MKDKNYTFDQVLFKPNVILDITFSRGKDGFKEVRRDCKVALYVADPGSIPATFMVP